MKLDALKKRLIRESIVIGGALGVCAVIYLVTSTLEGSISSTLTGLRNEQSVLASKIATAEREYQAVVDAFNRYKGISQQRLPTSDGLNTGSSRLRAAKPVIESLKARYHLTELEITFSNIEPDTKISASKSMLVFKNEMKLSFRAFNDELLLSFLHELIRTFPGYLQLRDLEMRRSKSQRVTPALLQTLYQTNPPSSLVDGSATLIWRTLKEVGAAAPSEASASQEPRS